jgi:hypothetical protein
MLLWESGVHVRFGEVGSVLWLLLLLCERGVRVRFREAGLVVAAVRGVRASDLANM